VKDDEGAKNTTSKTITVSSLAPTTEISTDKYEYTAGDVMLINITLANPTDKWQHVNFLWRLNITDYGLSFPIVNNKLLWLPPGFDKSFIIPWKIPNWRLSFNATWYVAFYNATTSEVISEDTADWRYVTPGKIVNEIMPSEIAEEINETSWNVSANWSGYLFKRM